MDKISGIVPSSHRVGSVDLKSAPPVRPGTPSFGRPQGISTLAEQNKPTTAQLAIAKQKELASKRAMGEKSPEFIQDMADKFFMQKKKEAGPVTDFDLNIGWQPPVDGGSVAPDMNTKAISLPATTEKTESVNTQSMEPSYATPESVPAEEREFTPPGSYLDVTV